MKFYIDSADINEIRTAKKIGVLDGVTTNPSLVAKTGRKHHDVIKDICSEVDGYISAEVIATDEEGMVREGRELAKIHDNVVVKVPMGEEGLRAVMRFKADGIKTNVTLVFNAIQALMVAKAGGTLVSPFVGRLDDISADGMDVVGQIVQIYQNYGYETEVLVASVRHPMHILDAAMLGAHTVTVPLSVIQQLTKHPLTEKGLAQFLKDAQKVPQ
jgi:transaldolase